MFHVEHGWVRMWTNRVSHVEHSQCNHDQLVENCSTWNEDNLLAPSWDCFTWNKAIEMRTCVFHVEH